MKTKLKNNCFLISLVTLFLLLTLFLGNHFSYFIRENKLPFDQCQENDENLISPYHQGDNNLLLDENNDLEIETDNLSSDSDSDSDDDTLENIESNELEVQENVDEIMQQYLQEPELLNDDDMILINLENVVNNENYHLIFVGVSIVIYENNISHNHYIFNTDDGELEYISII